MNVTVQLRNIKEDSFEDAFSEDLIAEDMSDACPNDTNEDLLHYFARLSNHYLRLAKSITTSSVLSRHSVWYPVIADSGANFHMFKEKEFFTKIIPATGTVILGDGHTALPILGVGTVQCKIGENVLLIEGVRYVPTLAESIYSLFVHIKSPGYGLHSSYDQGLFITFPQFQSTGIIGDHDIYIDMQPVNEDSSLDHDLNSSVGNKEAMFDETSICRHINKFQEALSQETNNIDNLLSRLRWYYNEIKSKRQLGLNVPTGFRSSSQWQQDFRLLTLPKRSKSFDDFDLLETLSTQPLPPDLPLETDIFTTSENVQDQQLHVDNLTETTTQCIPIIRSVDKVSSSIPKTVSMSEDYIRASVGFRHMDTLKRHFSDLYLDNVKLDNTPLDAVLDPGAFATMRKKDRNTQPVPRLLQFGDVFHIDIVFGPEISIGNIHYGLLFTDRYSCMTYLYPYKTWLQI
jgi:hypothetical protein